METFSISTSTPTSSTLETRLPTKVVQMSLGIFSTFRTHTVVQTPQVCALDFYLRRLLTRRQTASPLQGSLFFGSCAKAASSQPDLLNLDELFPSQTQVSGPSTTPVPTSPLASTSKRNSTDLVNKIRRSASCGVRKSSRQKSLSPRMSQPIFTRRGRQESWAERIEASSQAFNYPEPYHNAPLSTSPTLRPVNWDEDNSYNVQSSGGATGWTTEQSYSQMPQASYRQSAYHGTPLASPTVGHSHTQSFSGIQSPTSQYYTSTFQPTESSHVYTSPRLDRATSWNYDQAAEYPFASPVFNDATVQPWQPPDNSMMYQQGYQSLAAPLSYGSSMDETSYMQPNGLLIQNGSSSVPTTWDPYAPGVYTEALPQQEYSRISSTSSNSEQAHRKSEARSSRSPSPTGTTSPSQKAPRGHPRRKASNGVNRSAPGFVNLTPEDKTRILTGVAPSGSANTKKRREKEAAEKQRRKEEEAAEKRKEVDRAAKKAVLKARGDVAMLERDLSLI